MLTGETRCFRSSGPQYGEGAAPVQWYETLAAFLVELGFRACYNEKAAFINDKTGMRIAAYVDDLTMVGKGKYVYEFLTALKARFVCKDEEVLSIGQYIDLIGMELSLFNAAPEDEEELLWTVISMESYTTSLLEALDAPKNSKSTAALIQALECHCLDGQSCKDCWKREPVPRHVAKWFMQGVGGVGWLVATIRIDLIAPHIRLSQYMANPTRGAVAGLKHVLEYLGNTVTHCLRVPVDGPMEWRFFCDSDHAGNKEVYNKLRAQCCSIAVARGMPVSWKGGLSKMAFACEEIGEAHATTASGIAESFGAGQASYHLLPIRYIMRELKIPFPSPIVLELDATAAIAFVNGSTRRSTMTHIDQAQEWVITIRDKKLFWADHIEGRLNISDLGTKLQGAQKTKPLMDLAGLQSRAEAEGVMKSLAAEMSRRRQQDRARSKVKARLVFNGDTESSSGMPLPRRAIVKRLLETSSKATKEAIAE